MSTIKYLLFSLVFSIIGIAAGFYICKQTYQPLVAELKEQVAGKDEELVKVQEELEIAKNNVRVIFSHDESCVIEDTIQ